MDFCSRSCLVALVALALGGACVSPEVSGKKADPSAAKPATSSGTAAAPQPAAGTAPTPAEPIAPSIPEPTTPPPAAGDDPLGTRFADPSWFRKEMLEGATAVDVNRSERNEKGLFSSQILFDLPAGTTAEQCAEKLEAKVKADVPNLVRAPDAAAPGRLKITGDTPRYRVTMLCGEAKGVMRAYVGFEWLE